MIMWLWAGFIAFVLVMLVIDLAVLNRGRKEVRARQALLWTALCGVLALCFMGVIYRLYSGPWMGIDVDPDNRLGGTEAAMQFFTGWIVEQTLSLDNIFVISLIFNYFKTPLEFQHRTLIFGVLGALVMRGVMIGAGAALVHRFEWTTVIFGALLLYTAWKMHRSESEAPHPDRNIFVRAARRVFPVTSHYDRERFFTRVDLQDGRGLRRAITPLFLALIVIESSDVLFAIDSIPAIFAITYEPFIIFTSNVFAILNLRSMYFALADLIERFRYLRPSLVYVLAYVGLKMIVVEFVDIPTWISLAVIAALLGGGILLSVLRPKQPESPPA